MSEVAAACVGVGVGGELSCTRAVICHRRQQWLHESRKTADCGGWLRRRRRWRWLQWPAVPVSVPMGSSAALELFSDGNSGCTSVAMERE